MITVYHNPDFIDLTFSKNIGLEVNKHLDNLKEIAQVDTDDLNEAFKLTNNIEHDWTENDKVEVIGTQSDHYPHGFRSTSVGDCMEHNGQLYVVAPIGFAPVEGEVVVTVLEGE